eukprot:TRINITY_DN7485_c0_g1_i1.p1 TRINITY_DN7485_c0_g1~~TRINITY_DN7485_c0_g1_i1.p1  ORF type:complete len:271 (+),score=19.36 TRINITY_DN7485_c0_g1_i1:39-851(+)
MQPAPAPCAVCHRPGDKFCGACLSIAYCSRECQVAHWKLHKITCQAKKNSLSEKSLLAQQNSVSDDVTTTGDAAQLSSASTCRAWLGLDPFDRLMIPFLLVDYIDLKQIGKLTLCCKKLNKLLWDSVSVLDLQQILTMESWRPPKRRTRNISVLPDNSANRFGHTLLRVIMDHCSGRFPRLEHVKFGYGYFTTSDGMKEEGFDRFFEYSKNAAPRLLSFSGEINIPERQAVLRNINPNKILRLCVSMGQARSDDPLRLLKLNPVQEFSFS